MFGGYFSGEPDGNGRLPEKISFCDMAENEGIWEIPSRFFFCFCKKGGFLGVHLMSLLCFW